MVQPQQALLRLDDASQGLQAYAVAKPAKKASDGGLHATISHAALEKQIGQQVLLLSASALESMSRLSCC